MLLGKHPNYRNVLLPGTTRTQLSEKDPSDPEKRKQEEMRIPLGRTAEPEDMAGPAVLLASDMSRYLVSHYTVSYLHSEQLRCKPQELPCSF